MPLDNGYGVIAGTVASFERDDQGRGGRPAVGLLRLTTPEEEWDVVLDVSTAHGAGVSYRLVTGIHPRWMPKLAGFPDGLHRLAPTYESGAVDYVRSPVLRSGWAITWPWRMLLRGLGGAGQAVGLRAAVRRPGAWVPSDGHNALGALQTLLDHAARVLVFGEPGHDGRSVHNVHMNQGDPPGGHQGQGGAWQDGAVVTEDADGRYHVWQIRFNSQSLRGNPAGHPALSRS